MRKKSKTSVRERQFDIKALGIVKYFLGIEVAHSQHKYILDFLKETCMLDSKPASPPIDINVKLGKGQECP